MAFFALVWSVWVVLKKSGLCIYHIKAHVPVPVGEVAAGLVGAVQGR